MKSLFGRLFLTAALAATSLAQTNPAPAPGKPARPIPGIERVVILGLDGLRPDRLLIADAPVLRGLMARGSYSMWMQTTALATTLPSFTSMLTGISPRKHAIYWDKLLPLTTPEWPLRPTLFELAKRAGYSTALIAGKAKFQHLNKPGTIDQFFAPTEDKCPDALVTTEAIRAITTLKPDVLFVHYPGIDSTGHGVGWGSPEQLVTINNVDTQVGLLLAALDKEGLLAGALIIVSTDHGGAGTSHGPEDPRSRNIPWIIAGPGVRQNFDLTQSAELTLRTEDTCATACYVLGLPVPDYFEGKAVVLAFEKPAAK